MTKIVLVLTLALLASVTADPAILYNGYYSAPLTSAALVAPAVAPVASVAPLPLPYTSVYGAAYSYSDYVPVYNSAYSLPYALDWYYRK